MKKVLLILFMLFLITGCNSIQKMSIEEVIDNGINAKLSLSNEHRSGYKYYLPKGLRIIDKNDYNETLKSGDYTYYLYIDVISYFNKVIEKYNVKDNVYYSAPIDYKDKFGYLEIKNTKDDKYLIEIMYNYAKIEVIVREIDIKNAVADSISILNSIEYNNTMLEKIIGEETLSYNELEYNIFKTTNDSIYLESVNESAYDDEEEIIEIPDTDLVN